MPVRPGTHIRSLRMPPELAAAVAVAAQRMKMPENRLINEAVREVLRQAGIPIERAAEVEAELADPFA